MIISIDSTVPVADFPTETQGIFMKSQTAHIRVHEKRKRAKKAVNYSMDQILSCLSIQHFHN